MKDELSEIAIKHGNDRHPWAKHSYTPFYCELFKERKNTIKKVLEIGVGEHSGLHMWRDFFPNATIYGAEIDPERVFNEERIKVYHCDQTSEKDLNNLIKQIGSDIDFVVEDASHKPEDQVFTCLTLMPLLDKDTIYVIEDVVEPSITEQIVGYEIEIPALQRRKKRYDDTLIVVKHPTTTNISNKSLGISFFAPYAFLNYNPGQQFVYDGTKPKRGYLKRVSSIIREQIAEAVGAKFNPKSAYENDVCIYVKPNLNADGDFKFEGRKSYLDIADTWEYISVLKKHPEVGAIVSSQSDYISLSSTDITNEIVLIPQQHCNFERQKRTRTEITTVGTIGNYKAFPYLPSDLKPKLAERGMQLLEFSEFFTRADIIDFYMKIDLQIVWRPWRKKLANPQKIVNAASFGIPTIALDEEYFREVSGCYFGVRDLDHFLIELDRLRNLPRRYEAVSKLCREKAEEYHIDKVAQLYRNLAK